MELSHLDASGAARMVDVSGKAITLRTAVAEAFLRMAPETFLRLAAGDGPKGEVLATARVAGILAAKRTGELIPMCHPLPVEQVGVTFELCAPDRLRIEASARITARTGVEMEALTAAAVAGLTAIDMLKAIDRTMQLDGLRVVSKTGGKRDWPN